MKRVPLDLSEDLLARVDEAAGDVPRNRWIRRAIEQTLAQQPPSQGRHAEPAEDHPVYSVEFPIKLDDDYTCQGQEMPGGEIVAFDDLLNEGDRVAKFSDGEGNVWGPSGVVVRRRDGLWIVAEEQVCRSGPLSACRISGSPKSSEGSSNGT